MSKILLAGPAGSGKTHRLLDDFEQALKTSGNPLDPNFFFILPSAEHTERIVSLMVQRGIKGFFHRRVTTLSRLIETVFGLGSEQTASSVTRFLILKDLFERNSFEYFKEIQQSPGFIQLILSFIDELKEALIPVDVFRERMNALKRVEPDLALKYEALAGIYELYSEELTRQGLRDRQDFLDVYRKLRKRGGMHLPRFKKIWIDGFFDFSNLQLEYLRDLTELSEDTVITLTKDNTPERRDLFEPIHRTEESLVALGFKSELMKSPNRRAQSKCLVEMEQGLFSSRLPLTPTSTKQHGGSAALCGGLSPAGRGQGEGNRNEIKIFEAVGIEGEMEMIAREIEMSFRQGGYRYSDFAILLRKIGTYGDVIRSVFDRYEIPVEIHEREKLQFAPFIQVMVSLFRIFRDGWKRNDLIHFLKSSYVRKWGVAAKDEEWIHQLENWALFHGVLGGREEWLNRRDQAAETPFGGEFYAKKEQVFKQLAEFEDSLREVKSFHHLKSRIFSGLREFFGFFEIAGATESFVRRDAASYKRFEALIDEIGAFFKVPLLKVPGSIPAQSAQSEPGTFGRGTCFCLDAVADRFFRLVELDLYSLHHRDKNLVQVYDVSLARQKEYRVVFVAGLLEKHFPVQIKEDPILSDWERELFKGGDDDRLLSLRLERQSLERYLFYLAVTRAGERLYLTYPRLDLEGQESLPSYYVDEVQALFAEPLEIRRQVLARPYPEIYDALDERELEIALMGELWNPFETPADEELILDLTRALLSRPSGAKIKNAFYKIEARLSDTRIAEKDFFRTLRTSPTKLEEYGKCPYRYFANRVLCLKDPEEEVNLRLKGTILHQVLERFFIHWKDHPGAFVQATKIREFLVEQLAEALAEHPLIFEKKYQLELDREGLREYLERFIPGEIERLETSSLKPRYCELLFGIPEPGSFPALVLEDEGRKISISGKIDRVDVDLGGRYGLVIDYKTASQFKKGNLDLGIALQLPIYLGVIEKYLKLKPVGGELYSIKERKLNGFYHKENAVALGYVSEKKASAYSQAEFEQVLNRSLDFVKQFTREMRDLKIDARPRDPDFCRSYCSYAPVCRIEKWKLPMILEEIKEEDRKALK